MLNEKVTEDGRCYVCNRRAHVFVELRTEGEGGVNGKHSAGKGGMDEAVSIYRPGGRRPVLTMGIYHLRALIADLEDAERTLTMATDMLLAQRTAAAAEAERHGSA